MVTSKAKIAYLGPPGSFSHEAVVGNFPENRFDQVPLPSLQEVFDHAYHSQGDFAILPVENSTDGLIASTYHTLVCQGNPPKLYIRGEIYINVYQHLAILKGTELREIEYVHTKLQAWKQCEKWVRRHLPNARFVDEPSTSRAAQFVKHEGATNRAAICGDLAIKLYGLDSISRNIEDLKSNSTRFVIIGSRKWGRTKANRSLKSTLAIVLQDRIGALAETFAILSNSSLDVSNLKVHPVHAEELLEWKDWFFIDVVSAQGAQTNIEAAISRLRQKKGVVLTVRELGHYHCGTRNELEMASKRKEKVPPGISLETIMKSGEREDIEYKSTLRWNIREQKKDPAMEAVIVKTVAALMNSNGGYLAIGLDDNGAVLGLESDYKTLTKKPGRDGFQLHLGNVLQDAVGAAFMRFVSVRFESNQDGKDVCIVTVQRCPNPVFVKAAGRSEFYCRIGNQTRSLDPKELTEHLQMRAMAQEDS